MSIVLALILAAGDGGGGALDGTWQLELESSTNPTALLERLDVSWFIKKAAPSARPTHVIVTGDQRISIEVQSPLNTRKTTLALDGKTAATDDFFGNVVEYTARREGDTIITSGMMTSPKLGKVPLETRRSVQDDGTMLYLISLTFQGEPPTVLKRVFKRK